MTDVKRRPVVYHAYLPRVRFPGMCACCWYMGLIEGRSVHVGAPSR